MPDAHTYILMSPENQGGLYGKANGGWNYGYGVCASNIENRVSINWYETDNRYEDDLITALVILDKTYDKSLELLKESSNITDCRT